MSLKVNIKKRLGNFNLDVAFETERGVFAILGASGCGKSMTLKCIAGIETPDEGRIELNDRILYDSAKRSIHPAETACRLYVSGLCPVSEYDGRTEYQSRHGKTSGRKKK